MAQKPARTGERAVFDRNIVGLDDYRRAAEIDAAEHGAGLSDVHGICGWGILVRRLVVLADFRDVEQRRRGVWIAGHRIDAGQDGAGVAVRIVWISAAVIMPSCLGDKAGKRAGPSNRLPQLSGAEFDC